MSRDWKTFYRGRLPQFVDANGDLAPPWAKFPTYERGTIGWRMGSGEDWLSMWHVFTEDLDAEDRLSLLRRHPPAPVTWADWVYGFLNPGAEEPDSDEDDESVAEAAEAARRAELRAEGLIASDAAYRTWHAQQDGVRWPWAHHTSPADAARYRLRDSWFWSRQVAELRGEPGWAPPPVPPSWEACAEPLRTGEVRAPDPQAGLLTLARMLCAGRVVPPWDLGLSPADFADTFDDNMGYADAFRLWGICALDDREQGERFIGMVPAAWQSWVAEQLPLD